jgi:WD40 repeat protein
LLYVATADGRVRTWDVDAEIEVASPVVHRSGVRALAVSPDALFMASMSAKYVLALTDLPEIASGEAKD